MAGKPRTLTEERKAQMRAYSAQWNDRRRAAGLLPPKGTRRQSNPQNAKRRRLKEYIAQHKLRAGKCAICDMPCEEWNLVMFAWDHIDRSAKQFNLSSAMKLAIELEDIDRELQNCQLLCHNCHAYKTWYERDHDSSQQQTNNTEQPSLFNE